MPVIIRIAFRNLIEHKVKSFIIGSIITLGVIIIIVGNSLIDTAALGIRLSFIDNYTGHAIITGVADADVSIFGVEGAMGREPVPTIPEYAGVRDYLAARPEVSGITSQITGFGSLRMEPYEGRAMSLLFGIEPETYHAMFTNLRLVDGTFLQPGQEGILLSTHRIENLVNRIKREEAKARKAEGITEDDIQVKIKVGDPIIITAMSNIGLKIREVPLVGIVEFKNEAEEQKYFSFLDAQTLRALLGMTISTMREINLEEDETALLAADNLDDLFAEMDLTFENAEFQAPVEYTEEGLLNIMNTPGDEDAGAAQEAAIQLDTGAWNFILLKLHRPGDVDKLVTDLNDWFIDNGIAAVAGNWEKAAGPFATTADVIRIIFNIAIIIVGVVAILIIINTLIISIIERTSEIGTMRALGATKGFVWKMFITETLIIVLVFGIIGITLSVLSVLTINLIGIEATNTFLKILFAGPVLRPRISIASVLFSLGVVVGFGLLAHLYPVWVALKIRPIQAIQTE